ATRYLTSQRQDGATLWAHASGALKAPLPLDPLPTDPEPTPAAQADYDCRVLARDVWDSRDAATALALSELLPPTEAVHFAQVDTAHGIWDAVVARYSTPSSASLSRLLMPFVFPDLGLFFTVFDLVTHLHSLDAGFRAACTDAQLLVAPPPMWLTVHWLVTRFPGHLATARDVLLHKHPTELTIDLLETTLGKIEIVEDTAAVSAADRQKRGKSGNKGGKGGGGGGGGGGGAGSGGGGGGGGGAPGGGSLGGAVARSSTTLPCPVVPSGVLRGLHIPSFTHNLVGVGYLQDRGITVTFVGGGRTALCTDAVTGRVLATFTREPRSGLYVLHTENSPVSTSPQVVASPQVPVPPPVVASGQVAACCLCRSFTHRTLLWHHRLGHSSIPRLRTMASHCLVSGLPRVFPSLPPSPAPPCTSCVASRLHAAPHSSSLRLTTAPFQTLHLDVWGPAPTQGPEWERYFLVVVDNFSRHYYRILRRAGHRTVVDAAGVPTTEWIAERRIGLVMDIARTSMIHARAPHFLWPYAVCYAAHQLNLQPRVSRLEASPTSLCTEFLGVGSAFRVWGCLVLVPDTSADKLSACAVPCVFLGFSVASADWSFYHLPLHQFLDSCDVWFDESVSYYTWYPRRGLSVPPPPLFLAPSLPPALAPPVPPPPVLPRQSPQQPSALPRQVTVDSVGVGAGGAAIGGTWSGGARLRGARAGGAGTGGASSGGAGAGGDGTGGASSGGAGVGGPGTGGVRTGGARAGDPDPVGGLPACARGARAVGAGAAGVAAVGPVGAAAVVAEAAAAAAATAATAAIAAAVAAATATAAAAAPSRAAFVPAHEWPLGPCARPSSPATDLHTALLCTSLHCSPPPMSVLPSPPPSSLHVSPTPISDYYHAVRPVVSRVLATGITDPCFAPSCVSALTPAIADFAAARRLDYSTRVVPALPTRPLSVGGEFALGSDVQEDSHSELEYLAATSPTLCAMLLSPEGDPDAHEIPTRTYREAALTSTQFPLPGRPPGSPPVFKARYVARVFNQCEGVDFFQTFAPTPKMTTLRVLLHVAAQREYELHSLDFSTAFLQGRLHEEIWLRRPLGFIGTFPTGTPWSLRRPVYGLRHSPREWRDTLRSTLRDLGFHPSSADPSLFVRAGSTPFFILVYVDDLVFATPDRAALAEVKSELQKRHTCTDLGELQRYLGLQITRDRAARTITLTQSHIVQQVLKRFGLQFSTTQPTPLAVDHRLTGPFPLVVSLRSTLSLLCFLH
ncbi:unnamed protein product, partial [Closterium sp. NIES-54]